LRSKGVKYPDIRDAHERGKQKYGDRPFARLGFRTDGVGIFTPEISSEPEELSRRQIFFEEVIKPTVEDVIKPILKDVTYLHDRAIQFSPLGTSRAVVLDPRIALGSPIDRRSGVRTAVLHAMTRAGESNESVSDWYGVSVSAVRDAVEYEDALHKRAGVRKKAA
jgi:uncharacterized protein (DUF433 family)